MLGQLKQQFAHVKGITFEQRGSIILISAETEDGRAVVTTQGGCVLSFQSKQGDQQECLWVSESAIYDGSKPVRGGIPICWPWFGAAPREGLPAHGFVRNRVWQLLNAENLSDGRIGLELMVESDEETLVMWPVPFKLSLKIEVGATLTVSLTTTNLSDQSQSLTEAFHSYFAIADIQTVQVSGLEGSEQHDKLTSAAPVTQTGALSVSPPMDSVFLNLQQPLQLQDKGWQRQIEIQHQGAASAVVWNPGAEIIKGFADMDDRAWPGMLCVEVGNVLQNAVTIPSQASHSMTMTLKATSLT